ncbi:E3 ubiquitin-protein ligase [Elasticomyces elasticus]|nr:E3 ubiquitin-protein ligase [Elasticomyces elasticus]
MIRDGENPHNRPVVVRLWIKFLVVWRGEPSGLRCHALFAALLQDKVQYSASTLPTRDEFLANGLNSTTVPEDFVCPILFDYSEDAVKTPCGHIFDRESLQYFLESTDANKCPMCRTQFFTLPQAEEAPLRPHKFRLIIQAIGRAGLGASSQYGAGLRSYGYEIADTDRRRAATDTQHYLINPEQVSGPALINTRFLIPRLVAMANVTLTIRRVRGHAYTRPQRKAWFRLCRFISQELSARNGQTMDAMLIPALFRAALNGGVNRDTLRDEVDAFFVADRDQAPFADDLNKLLSFIAWCARDNSVETTYSQRWQQNTEDQQRFAQTCLVM